MWLVAGRARAVPGVHGPGWVVHQAAHRLAVRQLLFRGVHTVSVRGSAGCVSGLGARANGQAARDSTIDAGLLDVDLLTRPDASMPKASALYMRLG